MAIWKARSACGASVGSHFVVVLHHFLSFIWIWKVDKEEISPLKSQPPRRPQLGYEGAVSYISIQNHCFHKLQKISI